MENYLNNICDINSEIKGNKINNVNTISTDTFINDEKNNKKYSFSPDKIKQNNNKINLNENNIDDEYVVDINSTKNKLENNLNLIFDSEKTFTNDNINGRNIEFLNNNEITNNTNVQKNNSNENNENNQIRKDIFGSEIRKGGNHKVSFADNAEIIKSRMKLSQFWIPNISRNRASIEFTDNINNNNEIKLKKIRGNRRSVIGLSSEKILKRYGFENNDRKIEKLVEIIEVPSYKELNKINYYSNEEKEEVNENNFQKQDTVCCSGSCYII